MGSLASDSLKACAVPAKSAWTLGGIPMRGLGRLDGLDRVAERLAGRQVERDRDRGKLALVVDGERGRRRASRARSR